MKSKSKNILYLTSSLYYSKRRANFHHLSVSSLKYGHVVTFCTVPNSLTTMIRERNNIPARFKSFIFAFFPKKTNNLIVSSYVTLLHKNQKFTKEINKLADFLFNHGYSRVFKNKFDVIIFDSSSVLYLFPKIRKYFPHARFVYRVSDSLDYRKDEEDLIAFEESIIGKFDFISTTAGYITRRLKSINPKINIKTHFHGISKDLFNQKYGNPYKLYNKQFYHFVFVGASKLDYKFIDIASSISNNYIFHIIGPLPRKVIKNNIIYYGEMDYFKTIPFIKYADIGLQILTQVPHVEVFEKTLKFTQYTFVKIPIIAPGYLKLKDNHVFSYEHSFKSISFIIEKALAFDKKKIDNSWIMDWDEIELEIC